MDFVEVAGARIGFERRGDGQPLVLLHGIPGDGRVWHRQLESLAGEFDIVAWDAPGCGRSSDPEAPFGLTDLAQRLAALIDALGLDHPHVLGLSWGGGLALELYRIAPSVPRSLVLASAYAGWGGSLPAAAVAERLDAYLAAARNPSKEAMQSWGPGMFSEAVAPELIDELLEIASGLHPDSLSELARSFAATDLRAMLPAIDVPTLVLHGDADVRSPLDVGEALHAAIPGSQLVVLSGVGHVSNIEAPERFDDEVRRFLRSVPV